jgi:tetratricopeptide (TPR) repeat protein
MSHRRARLELSLVALGVLLLGLVPYPRALARTMRDAEARQAAGEYGAALAAYEQAAHLDPQSPRPWLRTGEILMKQHRYAQAADAFREAERRGSGVEAVLNLGESYAGRGDWTTAMETWLRARALAPEDARVYVALGRGSAAQSLFDQAQRMMDRALELEPAGPDATAAHALLGRLLISKDPGQAAVHFRLAGDEDMLAVLKAAEAEAEPGRRALLAGTAFMQRDELTLARRELERAIALTTAPDEAYAYLGHVLDQLGETVAARAALEEALQLNPESVLAYYFMGTHERQVGNLDGAQSALWEALLRDPENAALRVAMGETFVDLGDYAGAEEWYQGAVQVAPDDIEFHLLLIHFYVDHIYRIEAGGLPAAQAAVALAPDDPRALDLLGWAHHLAGHVAESELALGQALALDPGLVSAQYHLGSVLLGRGQTEPGKQHLQRAADLDTGGYYRLRAESLLADSR